MGGSGEANVEDYKSPKLIISQKTADWCSSNVSSIALFASERQALTTALKHVQISSWGRDGVVSVTIVVVGVVA